MGFHLLHVTAVDRDALSSGVRRPVARRSTPLNVTERRQPRNDIIRSFDGTAGISANRRPRPSPLSMFSSMKSPGNVARDSNTSSRVSWMTDRSSTTLTECHRRSATVETPGGEVSVARPAPRSTLARTRPLDVTST